MICKDNQVYETRSECPKTCLNLNGPSNCGLNKPSEGCFCKTGYVLDSNDNCVLNSSCGCLLPDGSGIISVIIFSILNN